MSVMAENSIWFMASSGRCYRFDLCGESLEVCEELAGSNAGKNDTPGDYSMSFRRVGPYGFVKPGVGEGNRYVAVYGTNTHDLICK
jgi:hypothetical protein